jgi:iron(III) transport system ATP-binding protein
MADRKEAAMSIVTTTTPAMNATETPFAVSVRQATKEYRRADGTRVRPLDHVTIDVVAGEFLVLLGPSGCGKTTLLRCIAGLEDPDEGTVTLDGRTMSGPGVRPVPPEKRGVGMIFQSYALWPHLTVEKNIAYPLQASRVAKSDIRSRVAEAMSMVGISDIAGQLPGALSGGQQQRVSLARALVAEPRVILFDEPLSNVDAKVRESLRFQLRTMQMELGFTAIYVTHDQAEAMELADRVAVLESGTVAQLASPHDVYHRPVTPYVARFVGITNEIDAVIDTVDHDAATLRTPYGIVDIPTDRVLAPPGVAVTVTWRPERTHVAPAEEASGGPAHPHLRFAGTVGLRKFLGPTEELVIDVPGMGGLRAAAETFGRLDIGDAVVAKVEGAALSVFAADEATS